MPQKDTDHDKRFWLERQGFPVRNEPPVGPRRSSCSMPDQYNLNEASRIRRMVSGQHAALTCPSCGGHISGVAGGHGDGAVMLLGCDRCGRSLVLPKLA